MRPPRNALALVIGAGSGGMRPSGFGPKRGGAPAHGGSKTGGGHSSGAPSMRMHGGAEAVANPQRAPVIGAMPPPKARFPAAPIGATPDNAHLPSSPIRPTRTVTGPMPGATVAPSSALRRGAPATGGHAASGMDGAIGALADKLHPPSRR